MDSLNHQTVFSPAEFESKYGLRLARYHARARATEIFRVCGSNCHWKLETLFEYALEHGKVNQVVNRFEQALEEEGLQKLEPLIKRPVAVWLLVDEIYGTIFRDVLQKKFPGLTVTL